MTTSERAKIFLDREEFLVAKFAQCATNKFDVNNNKNGFINLGTAQNFLCEKEIKKWLEAPGHFEHQTDWQHYTAFDGHLSVKNAVANFLTDRLCLQNPIDAKNLR